MSIERFHNTIGKELDEATQKFQTFLRDYHLEGSIGELEAEDEVDEFDSNMFEIEPQDDKPKQIRKVRKNVVSGEGSSEIQVIAPSNISITSATALPIGETEPTHVMVNVEEDPFEFKQEPEADVSVTPVTVASSSTPTVTITTKSQSDPSPAKKFARSQSRKKPEPPVLRTPSARTKKPVRR